MRYFAYQGRLAGHNGWVTSIATSAGDPDIVVSASRDKTIIVWDIKSKEKFAFHRSDDTNYGFPRKALIGHDGIVQKVTLSSDGRYALSASWDKTMRLWDISTGKTIREFVGHEKDVLSVGFSADDTKIVSGSRDKTIKIWNNLGECKYTFNAKRHSGWVSSVLFSPDPVDPFIVSGGWDKVVRVWDLSNKQLHANYYGHYGYINTVIISPDGSLLASGGKDDVIHLWDLNDTMPLYSLEIDGEEIFDLVFTPDRFWICAAIGSSVVIFDLETKDIVDKLTPRFKKQSPRQPNPVCLSLAWSADGGTLFAGYSDHYIRVWQYK